MATSDFFWKLFSNTGSIKAYLAYRHLHPTHLPT
ncbi:MAG: YqzL family protein [Vulcanimicrobiaceae bacterium]